MEAKYENSDEHLSLQLKIIDIKVAFLRVHNHLPNTS